MTTAEADSIDPAVQVELDRELAKVDRWFKRTQTEAPDPEPDSNLAVDDSALDPFQLSHAVVAALGTSVDHIHALRALIAEAHVVYSCATFTLLRASLRTPRPPSGCWHHPSATSGCCAGYDSDGPRSLTR